MTTQKSTDGGGGGITNLLDLTPEQMKNWLSSFDAVLTDCDGVLWHENVAIANSPAVIAALQALGKSVHLVTNNGMRTRRSVWERATGLGYRIAESAVLVPSYGAAQYLSDLDFKQRVYLMGSPATASELDAVGIRHFGSGPDILQGSLVAYMQRELLATPQPSATDAVGAVIVGFDEHFSFAKVLKASHYLTSNPACHFLATNGDVVFKVSNAIRLPDTGAMVKAVESCVGRQAVQMGKPDVHMCQHLLRDGVIRPERTLMIGDSARVDMAFGWNCGFQTLLVGSGQTYWSEVEQLLKDTTANAPYIPQFYVPTLGDLLPFVE